MDFGFSLCLPDLQKIHNFPKIETKPTMKCNRSTIKTLCKFCHIWICWEYMIDVAKFGSITRLSDIECYAFIRYLVIEFANNGKTLKLPKMECF